MLYHVRKWHTHYLIPSCSVHSVNIYWVSGICGTQEGNTQLLSQNAPLFYSTAHILLEPQRYNFSRWWPRVTGATNWL